MDIRFDEKANRDRVMKIPEWHECSGKPPEERNPLEVFVYEQYGGKLPKQERISEIWDILVSNYEGKERGEIDKEELAEKFSVTPKTIGNDLDEIWEVQNLNGVVKV